VRSTFSSSAALIDRFEGPVHSLDWCKSAPGQQLRPRAAFRLGIASFIENYNNRIAVIGLQDERVLVEDDYTDYSDFVMLCETTHGYPVTSLQWQPAQGHAWAQNSSSKELLAASGDALRVYEYASDGVAPASNYVGRQSTASGHSLIEKTALAGVSLTFFWPAETFVDPPRSNQKFRRKRRVGH